MRARGARFKASSIDPKVTHNTADSGKARYFACEVQLVLAPKISPLATSVTASAPPRR